MAPCHRVSILASRQVSEDPQRGITPKTPRFFFVFIVFLLQIHENFSARLQLIEPAQRGHGHGKEEREHPHSRVATTGQRRDATCRARKQAQPLGTPQDIRETTTASSSKQPNHHQATKSNHSGSSDTANGHAHATIIAKLNPAPTAAVRNTPPAPSLAPPHRPASCCGGDDDDAQINGTA